MAEEKDKQQNTMHKKTWLTSILLLLLALVCVSLTSLAWFSIADNTKLQGITMDVTTGPSLKFDLDPHEEFYDYLNTLSFKQIEARILKDQGYSISSSPMSPVTTKDCSEFTYEDGSLVPENKGKYITYTLNFMAMEDMVVHLTTISESGSSNGTSITSSTSGLKESMRIAFVVDGEVKIYDPGESGDYFVTDGNVTVFGLYDADSMVYSDSNALFSLKEGENKVVQVYIWLEGTDEKCVDNLKGCDYSIAMRFQGTDEDNNPKFG